MCVTQIDETMHDVRVKLLRSHYLALFKNVLLHCNGSNRITLRSVESFQSLSISCSNSTSSLMCYRFLHNFYLEKKMISRVPANVQYVHRPMSDAFL